MLLENGDPLYSRCQCENERDARYVADAAKKDLLRTGWAEDHECTLKPPDSSANVKRTHDLATGQVPEVLLHALKAQLKIARDMCGRRCPTCRGVRPSCPKTI